MSVVSDTHTIVWYLTRPQKLSSDLIYLSAISLVEICDLVERDRIPVLILERLQSELTLVDAGIEIIALDQQIGFAIAQIDRATVPDMPIALLPPLPCI